MVNFPEKQILIDEVVGISQRLGFGDVTKAEMQRGFDIVKQAGLAGLNLGVYEGYILVHYLDQFHRFPDHGTEKKVMEFEYIFDRCLEILRQFYIAPSEIRSLYISILLIPDSRSHTRDLLLGAFLASLWTLMNDPVKLSVAIEYGYQITCGAFEFDQYNDTTRQIKIGSPNTIVISLAGSGKKDKKTKLLNISSMASLVLATIGQQGGKDIVIAKTGSRSTSSTTGSSDIFTLLGVNLKISNQKMASIASKAKIGIFHIENMVPRLNKVYDGRLHDMQVFAGLIGGAAIVNPVNVDFINYGLTRGSNKVCLGVLSKIYPKKNIIVITGKDRKGKQIMDELSIIGESDIAQRLNGVTSYYTVTPSDFGFEFGDIKDVLSKNSPEANSEEFVKLLLGKSNKSLEALISMQVAINLFGVGVVKDLKHGARIALETIKSGMCISTLKTLIALTGGNEENLRTIVKRVGEANTSTNN